MYVLPIVHEFLSGVPRAWSCSDTGAPILVSFRQSVCILPIVCLLPISIFSPIALCHSIALCHYIYDGVQHVLGDSVTMDFDYELILSQTASLAIGNHPGSSSIFPGDADLPDDAMEVVGGSNNALPLHFDPETVVVGGSLTAHDVSYVIFSLLTMYKLTSFQLSALLVGSLDPHTLRLSCCTLPVESRLGLRDVATHTLSQLS